MIPTALTAFLALSGCVLAAVATGLARWSKHALLSTPTIEIRRGLWNWLDLGDAHYCEGWVIATATMIILAACFFLFTLLVAAVVLANKKVLLPGPCHDRFKGGSAVQERLTVLY